MIVEPTAWTFCSPRLRDGPIDKDDGKGKSLCFRVSGYGPGVTYVPVTGVICSPRERGWTLFLGPVCGDGRLLPARASGDGPELDWQVNGL